MACQEQSYLPLIRNDKLILSNPKCPLESSQQFSQDGHPDGCCQDISLLPDDHRLSTHYVSSQSVCPVSNLQEGVARYTQNFFRQSHMHYFSGLWHILILNASIIVVCVLFAMYMPNIGTIIR